MKDEKSSLVDAARRALPGLTIKALEADVSQLKQEVKQLKKTGVNKKKYIRDLLKQYDFPKKQKKLIQLLSEEKPTETKLLKAEVPTKHLSVLKKATLSSIAGYGLSEILMIKSLKGKGNFGNKYFYQLDIASE